ncbi:WD40 repeat-like protein, partial [Rhizopogon vinicolor AM-OR11-026]
MRGHTDTVWSVAHLPGRRQIITCSEDGSLRLWDTENGAQIGDDWRDKGKEVGVSAMALSPNGKAVASGSRDGKVKLWDVETRKVTAKWIGHSHTVRSVCWRGDGERVLSGSYDGTVRVWDVETGQTVLGPIKTEHEEVYAAIYSHGTTKVATGTVDYVYQVGFHQTNIICYLLCYFVCVLVNVAMSISPHRCY